MASASVQPLGTVFRASALIRALSSFVCLTGAVLAFGATIGGRHTDGP